MQGGPARAGEAPAAAELSGTNAEVELGPFYHYFEDPTGALGLRDVMDGAMAARFKPLREQKPNFGYTKSAMWVMAGLDNKLASPSEWLLEIPFPTLDSVEVYLAGADGRELARYTAGDLLPFGARPSPHRHFVFPVSPPPGERSVLFMRFKSQGSMTVASTLWPPALFN
ncbi:MAG: hypothetical protein HY804_01240 [Nitrospinae bacterium]|nr:hypothetical protein [Nitrospinota bacterium]